MAKKSSRKEELRLKRIDAILQSMIEDGTIIVRDNTIHVQELEDIKEIVLAIEGR